ncbi:hypothetical protein Tco_0639568 [Tanacetum coccineum]
MNAKLKLFKSFDRTVLPVTEDKEMSKKKEIDKLMALISLSIQKSYKPTTTTCVLSVGKSLGFKCYKQGIWAGIRESPKPKRVKDAALSQGKNLLCKQEEAGVVIEANTADWKDDTDDESEEQELEAHYMYMAQLQEVTPDSVDNSGPIFDMRPSISTKQ